MRVGPRTFIRRICFAACIGFEALLLSACQGCGNASDPTALRPLEERAVPERSGVVTRAPLGATDRRQVLLLFSAQEEECGNWLPPRVGQRFLLCVFEPSEQAESAARTALADLKKAYGDYVGPAPVLLVATEARADLGRALLLQEPSFFADVILFTPSVEPLTTTGLHGFGSKGGRALALVTSDGSNLDRFRASLRSQPFDFELIPPGPDAQRRSLALVTGRPKSADALGK